MLLAGAKKIKQGFEDTECWQGNRAKQNLAFFAPRTRTDSDFRRARRFHKT
jgi:hypothetical protein